MNGRVAGEIGKSTPLRESFAWTVAGNAVYAAGQWVILSLFAKLGSAEMLGEYALALAVASPVAMLANMNLRATIATDVAGRRPMRGYFAARWRMSGAGVAATAAVVLAAGYRGELAAAMVAMAASLAGEALSETCYGFLQRRERLDIAARSTMLRAVASVGALGVALWLTRSLLWALVALAAARVGVALFYDRPRAGAGGGPRCDVWPIVRTALPLGAVLMLVSLNTNVPRYAIEGWLGARELGAFAVVASFVHAGAVAVQALGHTVTPRLARYYAEGDLPAFRKLRTRAVLLALGVGATGVAGAAVFGKLILSLFYRPEYAAYNWLFVEVMGAATLIYVAVMLGHALTSARLFAPQAPLLGVSVAASAIASWTLVPRMGLGGAALALAIAACVQAAGAYWLLRSVERRHAA